MAIPVAHAITERIDTLFSKASLIAAGSVGLFNFIATEFFTGDKIFAAVLSAISIPAAAYFAARPKIIAAQAAREAAERSGNVQHFESVIKQMMEVHKAELNVKDRQIEVKEMEVKLVRISKHNALGALQHARFHILDLEALLRACNQVPPKYNPDLLGAITGHEDKKALELVESAAARIASKDASLPTNGN